MFSIRLKEIREKCGYKSQQVFADAFGVRQSTVGNWEAGKREPNYETIKRLADFFDVSIDYLLGRSDSPAQITGFSTNNPFSFLCCLYRLSDQEFQEISGISSDDILSIWLSSSLSAHDAATKPSIYQHVTQSQYERVSSFFEIPVCDLMAPMTHLDFQPKQSVKEKIESLPSREIRRKLERLNPRQLYNIEGHIDSILSQEEDETVSPSANTAG